MPYQKRHVPNCPTCGNLAEFHNKKIYCRKCSKYFDHANAPRVLILDIETSRVKVSADVWDSQIRYRDVRISHKDIDNDWFMICWRARWLFGKGELGAVVTPKEAKNRNDRRVVKRLFDVMKQAHFIITYNGDKFDLKKINWLFIKYSLKPILHYGSIDVMSGIAKVSAPTSKALDFISHELGYDGKLETDINLWKRAEAGDKKSLDYMYKYNMVDVDKTESVYLHVRPYLKNHPNFAEFLNYYQEVDKSLNVGKDAYRCPRCLTGIISKEKFRRYRQTPAGYFYKMSNCPHCGAVVFSVRKELDDKLSQKVFIK